MPNTALPTDLVTAIRSAEPPTAFAGRAYPRMHPVLDACSSAVALLSALAVALLVGCQLTALLVHLELADVATASRWIRIGYGTACVLSIGWATIVAAIERRRIGPEAAATVLDDGDGPVRRTMPTIAVQLTFVRRAWYWLIPCGSAALVSVHSVTLFSILIPPTIWLMHAVFQLHSAGRMDVRYAGRPYHPGVRATLTVGGQAAAHLDSLTLTLRCRMRGTAARSLFRRSGRSPMERRLQSIELTPVLLSRTTLDVSPGADSEVAVAFDLPARAPASRVGSGVYQIGWDIEVSGRSLGVPYVAQFPLWVDARRAPTADQTP